MSAAAHRRREMRGGALRIGMLEGNIESTAMHVLGIDAGGTKTVCLLADERGATVSEARGGPANLHASGELEVAKVLHDVMEEAIGERAIRPAAVCLGVAGVDREDEAQTVRAIMRRIGYKSRIVVVNDALIALAAGAGDAPGIVIVAGTGSIVYGRNARNEAALFMIHDDDAAFCHGGDIRGAAATRQANRFVFLFHPVSIEVAEPVDLGAADETEIDPARL